MLPECSFACCCVCCVCCTSPSSVLPPAQAACCQSHRLPAAPLYHSEMGGARGHVTGSWCPVHHLVGVTSLPWLQCMQCRATPLCCRLLFVCLFVRPLFGAAVCHVYTTDSPQYFYALCLCCVVTRRWLAGCGVVRSQAARCGCGGRRQKTACVWHASSSCRRATMVLSVYCTIIFAVYHYYTTMCVLRPPLKYTPATIIMTEVVLCPYN